MLKPDKSKDHKNKEKIELSKSLQNIAYMLPPIDPVAQ